MKPLLSCTLLFALLVSACGAEVDGGTDGNTHWLKCTQDSQCGSNKCVALRCEGQTKEPDQSAAPQRVADSKTPAPAKAEPQMGQACIPGNEYSPDFSGFLETDISLAPDSQCQTELCLVDHFRGRVSCPYGQQEDLASGACSVASGSELVSVPVKAQLINRRPADSVYCSCRCDGPEAMANYCACDPGFDCKALVPVSIAGRENLVGSYCVKHTESEDDYKPGSSCSLGNNSCGDSADYSPTALGISVPVEPQLATHVRFDRIIWQDDSLCLPDPLPLSDLTDSRAGTACRLFEAQTTAGTFSCNVAARSAVSEQEAQAIRAELLRYGSCESGQACAAFQFCEIPQLTAASPATEYASCLDEPASSANGWCYLDLERGLGSPSIVASCDVTDTFKGKYKLRFVGNGTPRADSKVFIACVGG